MITCFSMGLISPGFFVGDIFSLLVAKVFSFFSGEEVPFVGEEAISIFFLD